MVWSNPHLQLKREAASWESLPENIKKMILNGERMSVLLAGLPYERFLMYSERIVDGQYVSPTLPRPGRLGKIEKYVLAWAYRQRRAIVSIHTPTVNCALPKSRLMLSYAKNELDIPIPGRVHGKSLENSRYTKRQQVFGRMRRLYGVEHSLFGHPLPAGPIRQSYVSFNGVLRRALGSDEEAKRLANRLHVTFDRALRSLCRKGMIELFSRSTKGLNVEERMSFLLTAEGARIARGVMGKG